MKLWLPYIAGGSGADVFTELLARGLREAGHAVNTTRFAHAWQYAPHGLSRVAAPADTELVIANTMSAFAFRRPPARLVAIEHHCVLDPDYAPFRSRAQAIYHELLVRRFERRSLRAADAVVAVSAFTANSIRRSLDATCAPHVIVNGIDTDWFCPAHDAPPPRGRPHRLLFVGNVNRRKGADLLPAIMRALGGDYELRYTAGLRARDALRAQPGLVPLGRLDDNQLRAEYRAAELLVFPTRFEGFGYAAAEALACGTPVVTSDRASLPELIDESCGRLCPVDDVDAFVRAIRELCADPELRTRLAASGRARACARFDYRRMIGEYLELFRRLV